MISDKELIDLMISEPSWEDVIIRIVSEEDMDPWNIDVCKLADIFMTCVEKMDKHDLRIPARFILISAILVRMKSDILVSKKNKILIAEGEKPENPLLRILAEIPPLEAPIKRVPVTNVSVEELVIALKKAFEIKERRVEKKYKVRKAVNEAMPEPQDDINKRIDNLLGQIHDAIIEIKGSVKFSQLVKTWEREDIVKTLMPLLHLTQDGKTEIEQEEIFKDIHVKMKRKKEE